MRHNGIAWLVRSSSLSLLGMLSLSSSPSAFAQARPAPCHLAFERMRTILGQDGDSDTVVLAHRGFWGAFSRSPATPESSYPAISAATRNCADGVELDVKVTQNGEPIIMHDFNLGRTTNVWQLRGGAKFDPRLNTGQNVPVASLDSSTIDRLFLLTPDRTKITNNRVPKVDDVLRRWVEGLDGGYAPLVFDIKSADAVRAVDAHVGQRMAGYGKTVVAAKVNATLYSTPGAFFRDSKNMSPIPVFTTNMLGVTNVPESVLAWSLQVNTLEINVKEPRGLLSPQFSNAYAGGNRIGVFQAIPDGPRPGEFYRNTGACCYRLEDLLYTYRYPGGTLSDTTDLRGSLNYIVAMKFGLITTDDPDTAVRYLAARGLRRNHPHSYPIVPN